MILRKYLVIAVKRTKINWDETRMVLSKQSKATITRCDISFIARFFCIDATLLCKFESDKIRINEFE